MFELGRGMYLRVPGAATPSLLTRVTDIRIRTIRQGKAVRDYSIGVNPES